MEKPAPSPLWPGLAAPMVSAALGAATYVGLTRLSPDPDQDYLLRLSAVALVMLAPPVLALRRFVLARRAGTLTGGGWIGAGVAVLALGLVAAPIGGAVRRARQAANLALEGVPAPEFRAQDLDGRVHRLSDHAGSVVLVNIWATWCPPCRAEMPELDRLARERGDQGFAVFGISTEDRATQDAFRREMVRVDYPLLLPGASTEEVLPDIYTETARYPANFLIDRDGLLHPAPSTDQPFTALEEAVDELLAEVR